MFSKLTDFPNKKQKWPVCETTPLYMDALTKCLRGRRGNKRTISVHRERINSHLCIWQTWNIHPSCQEDVGQGQWVEQDVITGPLIGTASFVAYSTFCRRDWLQFRGVLTPVWDSHVQYLPRGCQEFQSLLPQPTNSRSEKWGVGELFFLFLCYTVPSPLSTTSVGCVYLAVRAACDSKLWQ